MPIRVVDVVHALASLGGEAHNSKIYGRVVEIAPPPLPEYVEETVRAQILQNCKQRKSKNTYADIFESVHGVEAKKGVWRFSENFLRANPAILLQDNANPSTSLEGVLANTPDGIRLLEESYLSLTPIAQRMTSNRIERGPVGEKVKKLRQGRCQICEAMGENPIAFVDHNGHAFAEAHHVVPVSERKRGSLSYLNIMVLCPNHHRQAHYGAFEVVVDGQNSWTICVDDNQVLRIPKAQL